MNRSDRAKYDKMTVEQRRDFLLRGRMTIHELSEVKAHKVVVKYFAKIRGVIISSGGCVRPKFKFDTPQEAEDHGRAVIAKWKAEAQNATK